MIHHVKHCFTIYSTTRQVNIKSTFLAVTYILLVITVWIAYIGSLQLDIRKVYQKSCPVHGAIVSKVKGVLSTENLPNSLFQVPDPSLYKRFWDTSDLIFPPYGGDGVNGGFVAVTNLIITPNQTVGVCPETSNSSITFCKRDEDCKRGLTSPSISGILTGKCNDSLLRCDVNSWCPVEHGTYPLKGNRALFEGVQNFTVMLKNSAEFPECGSEYHRRNILENATKKYLSECVYDIHKDVTCPIFRIGDVITWSGSDFSEVAMTGGVFRIEARWDCDFDWGSSVRECFPKYYFARIDEADARISPGWNFRMASYHEEYRRTLKKMYGVKILIEVTGEGKQFDFLTLILTLGSTIGLFTLAPLVCDTLFELLCWLKRFHPFSKCFLDFSKKSRYQDSHDIHPQPSNKFELAASNNTIEESVGGSYHKPS